MQIGYLGKKLLIGIIGIILFSTVAYGKDYFLYDKIQNQLQVVKPATESFNDKTQLVNKPDLIIPTNNPGQFLLVYIPGQESGQKTSKIPKETGKLLLWNAVDAKIEDTVETGYAPFNWTYSTDHRHFFISFRASQKSVSCNLLHYDIAERKAEQLTDFAQSVAAMNVTLDGNQVLAVVKLNKIKLSQLLGITHSPLTVKTSLPVGSNPSQLFILSSEKVALLDLDQTKTKKETKGTIRLIDIKNNTTLENRKIQSLHFMMQWFPKQKILLFGFDDETFFTIKSRCYKLSADGLQIKEIPSDWIGLNYFPDKDWLYVLTQDNLKLIDYQNSTVTTFNTSGFNNTPFSYKFLKLTDTNLAVIYSWEDGVVKFFDLDQNKVLRKIKTGRSGKKVLNTLLFQSKHTSTVITTNSEKNGYYIKNQATNDIMVLDSNLKNTKYIIPKEPLTGMFSLINPVLQTIVTTKKRIYKIDDQNAALVGIYNFKTSENILRIIEDNQRVIILTDKELLVFDEATLGLKNSYPLMTASKIKSKEPDLQFIEVQD